MSPLLQSCCRAALLLLPAALAGCASDAAHVTVSGAGPAARIQAVATFGAGCFWCSEAAYEQLDGVLDVQSGFMGDAVPAEVVQVTYDPQRVKYDDLLGWFWRIHDPTSLNRQGEDEGPEYRSVIFVHGRKQRRVAEASRVAAQARFARPIVTDIEDAGDLDRADEAHQDYYRRNKQNAHCQAVIAPHLRAVGLED